MPKILSILRRALNCLFHQGRLFRMNPLENKFEGGRHRSVVLKDAIGFLRPQDLAGGNAPAEATDVAEPLSARQVRFPPPWLGLRILQIFVGSCEFTGSLCNPEFYIVASFHAKSCCAAPSGPK